MPTWLDNVFGPRQSGRVVSVTRNAPPQMPQQQPGGGFDLNALLKQMQGQYDASNKAGLEQYQHLMDAVNGVQGSVLGAGGLYDQAGNALTNMGTTARSRIAENTIKQKGVSDQDLQGRGLYNTTIASSVNRGIESDAERANQAVDEQVGQARAGLATQRAGATMDIGRLMADSILSRRNEGPDASMYANLIASLARNGGLNGPFPQGAGSYGATGPGGGGGGRGTYGGSPGPAPTGGGGGSYESNPVHTVTGERGGGAHVLDPNTLEYWKGYEDPQAALFNWRQRNGLNYRTGQRR